MAKEKISRQEALKRNRLNLKSHYSKKPFNSDKSKWHLWSGRVLWVIAGGIFTAVITFISQGPDSIRKIPEIPSALIDTVTGAIENYQIDQKLSKGDWEFLPDKQGQNTRLPPIRLRLYVKDGQVLGELYSPAVKNWTIWDMALIEGVRDKEYLYLTVFDFIFGKKTILAKLKVGYAEERENDLTDHIPELVDTRLRAETLWQKENVLQKQFTLNQVSE